MNISEGVPNEMYREFMPLLPKETQERILRYYKEEDAARTFVGHVLIRKILSHKLQKPIQDILFTENEYGKPLLAHHPDVHFNLSHAKDWVVGAVDHFPVGIDVEYIRQTDMAVAQRFFTTRENELLFQLSKPERLALFFDIWTLKESYIKAIGKGLSLPLDSFTVLKKGNNIIFEPESREEGNTATLWRSQNSNKYHFKQYSLHDDYTLSVCATHLQWPGELQYMSINELYKT
ncbi:4'-phosphopantetheinyl transferase superfamily protein [Caldalkalibacillus salinus]|uniref:4'-phosphopantetheinyl transferase superfamily protein n=1 Tax=Caldalkalibacillus salinus TaxID=2803787 RepID=UPI00192073B1